MRPIAAFPTRFLLAVGLLAAGAGLSAVGREGASEGMEPSAPGREATDVAYHLRVVRVTGSFAPRGAGLGCTRFCGTPIVLPSEEAWGTPEQLTALAHVLGGGRADAVTGFLVDADESGEARFEGTIYPGETWVDLRFTAKPPAVSTDPHEMELILERPGESGPPLAEAHVLARDERTVAIAAPSPIAGEWIVLAVTPMDPAAARERIEAVGKIRVLVPGPDVTPPERLRKVDPVYPETARKEHRSGKVVLEAVVDTDGIPRAIRVLRVPPGCEDMAAASVEAVQQWRYKPATFDGRPVAVYFTIQVEYMLD